MHAILSVSAMHAYYQSQQDTHLEAMPNVLSTNSSIILYLQTNICQFCSAAVFPTGLQRLQHKKTPNITYKWSIERTPKNLMHKTEATVAVDHRPQKKISNVSEYVSAFLHSKVA